jgi:hypothetical protein
MTICGIPNDVAEFDTNDVWTSLSETGRYKTVVDFCNVNDFRNQLHAEALEEDVQLRIDVSCMPDSRPTLYIYLRKQV